MNELSSPLFLSAFMVGTALLPLLFLMITPFLKLSIVFGVLRIGFGSQGVPGNAALGALSLILSLHIAGPMFSKIVSESQTIVSETVSLNEKTKGKNKTYVFDEGVKWLTRISAPIENFLSAHCGKEEIEFFSAGRGEKGLLTLIPAFVLTELRTGFLMALYLFLPFILIDLVVTTVLTGMGMMMVNPIIISFPLKLILFVSCNGWLELSKNLVQAYSDYGTN